MMSTQYSKPSLSDKIRQGFSVSLWDLKSCKNLLMVFGIVTAAILFALFTIINAAPRMMGYTDGTIYSDLSLAETCMTAFVYTGFTLVYLMTIIFTIIYTIKNFSYLHDKRKGDMYGSLPISRITLLVSKIASSLVFSLVPSMIFLALITLTGIVGNADISKEMYNIYIELTMGTLASITGFALMAVCCGTTANTVVHFIAICAAYPTTTMFLKGAFSGFMLGFDTSSFTNSFAMFALNPLSAYDGKHNIYWLIFSMCCILLACYLVRNRKAERAQSSFAYFLPSHIIKVLITTDAGLILGYIFGTLDVFGNAYLGFLLGFFIASAPTYLVFHLIQYRGLDRFLKTSYIYGGVFVAVALLFAVLSFDVFGYNQAPKAEDVESAGFVPYSEVYVPAGKTYDEITKGFENDFTDKDIIKEICTYEANYLKNYNQSPAKKFSLCWSNMFNDYLILTGNSTSDCIKVGFKTKDGRSHVRINNYGLYDILFNIDSYVESDYYDDYNELYDELHDDYVTTDDEDIYGVAYTQDGKSVTLSTADTDEDFATGEKKPYGDNTLLTISQQKENLTEMVASTPLFMKKYSVLAYSVDCISSMYMNSGAKYKFNDDDDPTFEIDLIYADSLFEDRQISQKRYTKINSDTAAIFEALQKDYAALNSNKVYTYDKAVYYLRLNTTYDRHSNIVFGGYSDPSYDVYITEDFTNTIEALKSVGIIKSNGSFDKDNIYCDTSKNYIFDNDRYYN